MSIIEISTIAEYIEATSNMHREWHHDVIWYRGVPSKTFEPIPGLIWRNLWDDESDLVHDFLVSYRSFYGNTNIEAWDLYALMQHHGLPTRLLDWTKSPLVALYFALERYDDEADQAAVWVIQPQQLNKFSLGEPVIYCPSELKSRAIPLRKNITLHLDSYLPAALDVSDSDELPELPLAIEPPLTNARIRAQQGCFTVHGHSASSVIEVFNKHPDSEKWARQIVIKNHRARENLMTALYSLGFTEDFIYQDLDALSRRIVRNAASVKQSIRNKDLFSVAT